MPDVYERAMARLDAMTSECPCCGQQDAEWTLLRALLVEREIAVGGDPSKWTSASHAVDEALAAFVGDTQIHD